jgi:branched-chain amino acid transport system ATP-binding protein
MPDLLEATDVEVRFGGVTALAGVSLSVGKGEIVGLLGPNGAGKTTLFNVVLGTVRAAAGEIAYDGAPTTGFSPMRMFELGLARTFQIPEVVTEMSVLDNVLLGCQAMCRTNPAVQALRLPVYRRREKAAHERAREALDTIGLGHLAGELVGRLSLGQIRLVELARCLAAQPKLLLLDEVASGLTNDEIEPLKPVLHRLAEQSTAILLVEHNVSWALSIVDRVYVLDGGRVLMHGTPDAVREDPDVIAAYLGSHKHA